MIGSEKLILCRISFAGNGAVQKSRVLDIYLKLWDPLCKGEIGNFVEEPSVTSVKLPVCRTSLL